MKTGTPHGWEWSLIYVPGLLGAIAGFILSHITPPISAGHITVDAEAISYVPRRGQAVVIRRSQLRVVKITWYETALAAMESSRLRRPCLKISDGQRSFRIGNAMPDASLIRHYKALKGRRPAHTLEPAFFVRFLEIAANDARYRGRGNRSPRMNHR